MRLKGKKVVLLAENNYEDLELWVPYYRLKEEGALVTIVGTGSSQTYTSKHGYPVQVNKEAKEIDISQYDEGEKGNGLFRDQRRLGQRRCKLCGSGGCQRRKPDYLEETG
jgi:hypothetical protein